LTDLAERLAAFLTRELPDGANPQIADLEAVSGGNARAAWRFDLVFNEGDGHLDVPCIMLMQAAAGQLESDLAAEFRVLSALSDAGVRAPRAFWLDADGSRLGAPTLIMERVSGTTDILALRAPEPAGRNREIARDFARCAAELHRADWRVVGLSFPTAPSRDSAAGEQVAFWEAQFLKHRMEPHPIIVDAFGWLKQHAPVADRIAVVHGDFRFGNFLYEGERITALLDWEMAHLGDPVEDLAWAYRALWTPEMHLPLDDFVALYEKESGVRVDPQTLLFYRLFGEIKHAVISLTAARSFADGRTRNLKLADRMTLVPPCLRQFLEWLPS
jgi:aminoglycoside phosphotransferase (APT) family kinase protein